MNKTILALDFKEIQQLDNDKFDLVPKEDGHSFYAFHNGIWYSFQFYNGNMKVHINVRSEYRLNRLLHVFSIDENRDLLITTATDVIYFHISQNQNSSKTFNYIGRKKFNWLRSTTDIIFDRFFYDFDKMGAVVLTSEVALKFLQIEDSSGKFEISEYQFEENVFNQFCLNRTDIMVARLKKEPQKMVVTRDEDGLCVFQHNFMSKFRFIMKILYSKTENIKRNDKVFFANLSGHDQWMDMIAITSNGLFLFQYNANSTSSYQLINYNPKFSTENKWTNKHTESIRFVDINQDGFDDLIFTGPSGIEILSYDVFKHVWNSLLYTGNLNFKKRHSIVLQALPQLENIINNPKLVTCHSYGIHEANIRVIRSSEANIKSPPVDEKFHLTWNNKSSVPKIKNQISEHQHETIYLRDQKFWFEGSTFTINPQSGKPLITLPLIGNVESMIKFLLYYDVTNMASEALGISWYTGHNFIALSYHNGNFKEDEKYVLVIDSIPYNLIPVSHSKVDIINFEIENSVNERSNIDITYQQSRNIWHIYYGLSHQEYYGRFESLGIGATVTDVTWENWRGYGIDSGNRTERPYIWYLAVSGINKIETYYEYDITRKLFPGTNVSFNSDVSLKQIYNKFNTLTFSYTDSHLSSYAYTTKSTQQMINFKYSSIGNSSHLISIDQVSDYIDQPIVQFKYSEQPNGKQLINRIILPTGAEILYDYELLGSPQPIADEDSLKIPVSGDYDISYGPNLIIVSYIRNEYFFIRVFNYDLSEDIQFPPTGLNVKASEILIGDNFFAVNLFIERTFTKLCFFVRRQNDWTREFCLSPHQESTILKGNTFIVISEPTNPNLIVMEYFKSSQTWVKSEIRVNNEIRRSIAVYGSKFVAYNDDAIFLIYKENEDKKRWISKELVVVSEFLSETYEILRKFDFDRDFKKAMFIFFKKNSLHFSHNIVVLSSLAFYYKVQFVTKIKIYTIGQNHEVVKETSASINQDYIWDLESEQEIDLRGRYTYKYNYENDKFNIVLGAVNLTTIPLETLDETIFAEMNNPAKGLLLNLRNYYISIKGQIIKCRNVTFEFGGENWHRHEFEKRPDIKDFKSMRFSEKFSINKTDLQSTIKLYDTINQTMLFDFGITDIEKVQIEYPNYIAFQKNRKSVFLIEFIDNGNAILQTTTLKNNRKLTNFGNKHFFITYEDNDKYLQTLYVTPINTIRDYLPNLVVVTKKIIFYGTTSGYKVRTTGYDYQEKSARLIMDTVYYNSLIVFPGNNPHAYGYFNITAKTVDFFNSNNVKVKTLEKDLHTNDENDEEIMTFTEDETILYSKIGAYEIAHFAPYTINSDMCAFIGFEEYEQVFADWRFIGKHVVSGNFSLTGNNYLRLKTSILRGIFRPKFQNQKFIASCWIRIPIEKTPTPGDIIPYLMASILTSEGEEIINVLADVKYQIDDWSCLQVVIDLEFTHLLLKSLKNHSTTSESLLLDIRVSPSKDVPIDLDHMRFSHFENVFTVNVFDIENDNKIATINPSGTITKYLYDKYKVIIAEINESNQIREFKTYTKGTYSDGRFGNPACTIKIIPKKGSYEFFSPNAFRSRWSLTNLDAWNISPSTLEHTGRVKSELFLESNILIGLNSYGTRFMYSLMGHSIIKVFFSVILKRFNDKSEILLSDSGSTRQAIPSQGEILIIKQDNRILIWIDGGLYIDQFSWKVDLMLVEVKGKVKIQHMMMFERPQVEVVYKNALNEEIQKILLISSTTAIVNQFLYDELGRQVIDVQPIEISRKRNNSLMAYVADLVTNDDPNEPFSIWETGKLAGEINEIIQHEYGFTRTIYDDSPLSRKKNIGIPGKNFTSDGIFAMRFESSTTNRFLRNYYPQSENFTYHVEMDTHNSDEEISIYDINNLKIASYIHLKHEKDSFSTFEYNQQGLMTKARSPMYYSIFGVFDKELNLNDIQENHGDHPLEINIEYDKRGNPIRKILPDLGLQENVYDDDNRLRFMIQYHRDNPKAIEYISYFEYDKLARITRTGGLITSHAKDQLLKLNITEKNSAVFQRFHYNDNEGDPASRGKILSTITMNYQNDALYEESLLDVNSNLISKRYIYPNGNDGPEILSINKQYDRDVLKKIIYPAAMSGELFQVAYEYDKLDRMISIGIPGQPSKFMSIVYDASNRITNETFSPLDWNKFVRHYKYNEPGYLIEIIDKFFEEEISYIDKAYGRKVYGDGTISRIKFKSKWHTFANSNQIGLNKNSFQNELISSSKSRECYNELKTRGYLNNENLQTRIFYPNLDSKLSFACINGTMGKRVKEVLGKYGFPKEYGFRFDFMHQKELKTAKYFVGSITEEPEAFQSDSFARNIIYVSSLISKKIFDILMTSGYIVDRDNSLQLGKSFIRRSLAKDLKSVNSDFEKYSPLIEKLLIKQFIEREKDIRLDVIRNIFIQETPERTFYPEPIYEILSDKQYFEKPFDSNFTNILKDYKNYLPDIIKVIRNHLGIDRAEFDGETKKVDLNGNRIQFNSGFDDYFLSYEQDCNRINEITKMNHFDGTSQAFQMHHDSRGNVIQALHKGIQSMDYHPVSNRLQTVRMVNGDNIIFYYDSRGERYLKRVTDSDGITKLEIQYLRDENGRSLVERKLTFVAKNQDPDILVTMYIYGPKSLIGFVRRDQFYSVLTDHLGSVRLILRDDEVVAAYDYMPYGELMRFFESVSEAQIPYKFTGQEFDSEIGLYNFHTRFYDPSIGRFYQIDPAMQYFTPYKYSGNSPVSMVDPSGSIAFIIVLPWLVPAVLIALGLLGAYLGGATVNGFNILNWDWSSEETQYAVGLGFLTAMIIPTGFLTSVGLITAPLIGITFYHAIALTASAGITGAYIFASIQQEDMNPLNWNYSSPSLYYSGISGFSTAVNLLTPYRFTLRSALVRFIKRNTGVFKFKKLGEKIKKNIEKSETKVKTDFPITPLEYRFYVEQSKYVLSTNNDDENLNKKFQDKTQRNNLLALLFGHIDLIISNTYYNIIQAELSKTNIIDFNNNGSQLVQRSPISQTVQMIAKEVANILNHEADSLHRVKNIKFSVSESNLVFAIEIYNVTLISTLNRYINPSLILNTTTGYHRPTTVQGQLELIHNLTRTIHEADEGLNEFCKINLKSRDFTEWIGNIETFKKNYKLSYMQWKTIVEKFVNSNDFLFNRNIITSIISKIEIENMLSPSGKQKLFNKEHELKYIQESLSNNNSLSFSRRNELKVEKTFSEISIKTFYVKVRDSINTLSDILSKKLKTFEMPCTKWKLLNAPYSMSSKTNQSIKPNSEYSAENFVFLSSYRDEDIPDLGVFQKCYTCTSAPSKLRTKVEDIEWLAMLNEGISKNRKTKKVNNKRRRRFAPTSSENEIHPFFKFIEWPNTSKSTLMPPTYVQVNQETSTNDRQKFDPQSNIWWNVVDFGDKFFSQMNFNNSFMLAGFIFSKYCKRNFLRPLKKPPPVYIDGLEKIEFACKVVQLHKNAVKTSAHAIGIKNNRLNLNMYAEMYEKILKFVIANRFDDIFKLLLPYALMTLPPNAVKKSASGEMSKKKRKQFEYFFNNLNLSIRINEFFIEMKNGDT